MESAAADAAALALEPAAAMHRDAQAIADHFPAGAGLADQLTAVAAPGPVPRLGEPLPFTEALLALYRVAGEAPPADVIRPPPEPVASAAAPLLQASALSAALVEEAFAALEPGERDALLRHVTGPGEAPQNVDELLARVDVTKLHAAGIVLARALDAFPDELQATLAVSWVDPLGLVEIGSVGDEVYNQPRVLILDLGGDDRYEGETAAFDQTSSLLPVVAVLDLGGNDVYVQDYGHSWIWANTVAQGVGIGGVGLLVDRWGDDTYTVKITDKGACENWDYEQKAYAQGVGELGVGALADLSGDDAYYVESTHRGGGGAGGAACDDGQAYVYAQGVGLTLGIGLLVDDTGHDTYTALAHEGGEVASLAHVHAQGASAGGVGVLTDKEGNDDYVAYAESGGTQPNLAGEVAGNTAYTFAQGAVFVDGRSGYVTSGFPALHLVTSQVCSSYRALDARNTCGRGGLALLLEITGYDTLTAKAFTNVDGCSGGTWSVASGQGSAGWGGVAALANLDVGGHDVLTLESRSIGDTCPLLHVNAHTYGQGYGGPIAWDYFDAPWMTKVGIEERPVGISAEPTWVAPIGLLASGRPTNADICLQQQPDPHPWVPDLGFPCYFLVGGLAGVLGGHDEYYATADAVNSIAYEGQGGRARVYAQGMGGNLADTPVRALPYPNTTAGRTAVHAGGYPDPYDLPAGATVWTEPGVGLGLHVDVGGNDVREAVANATSPAPDATVHAQGAGLRGVGILGDVAGSDIYTATANHNGIRQNLRDHAQAYGEGATDARWEVCRYAPGPACSNSGFNPVFGTGVLVDVGGWDLYSEASDRSGCQSNGALLPSAWGSRVAHPCSPRTPASGWGESVGVDVLSFIL